MNRVEIKFQPDFAKTIADGEQGGMYQLTPEQYWGMLTMTLVLFGGDNSRIIFTEVPARGNRREVKLPYLTQGGHIIAYDPKYNPNRIRDPWEKYLGSFLRGPQLVNGQLPADLFANYIAHLVGKGEAVVRFKTPEFVQGAITVLNWFGYRPEDYIFEIYNNGEDLVIV